MLYFTSGIVETNLLNHAVYLIPICMDLMSFLHKNIFKLELYKMY